MTVDYEHLGEVRPFFHFVNENPLVSQVLSNTFAFEVPSDGAKTDTTGAAVSHARTSETLCLALKEPLSVQTCWTEVKGGGGNINNDISISLSGLRPNNPEGNYLATGTNERSLTAAGTHPEMNGATVTGQRSKLGLGQAVEGDLISFVPIASTIADVADHWGEEPYKGDIRRRYAATVLTGVVHIGECRAGTVKLAITVEMKGTASGEATYETQLLTSGVIKGALLLIPDSALEAVGAQEYLEKYVLKHIGLGMGADGAFSLAYDSRFRAFSELCVGLGNGSFYQIDDNPTAWSVRLSDFSIGTMTTDKFLPTAWGVTRWLRKTVGRGETLSSSIIWRPSALGAYDSTIQVQSGSDLPITVLLRTYAETAGYASAEARIEEFSITITAPDYPEGRPLSIKSVSDSITASPVKETDLHRVFLPAEVSKELAK